MTNDKPVLNANILGLRIGGLVMFVVGIMVLLPSLLGYWDTIDEKRSLKEKAEQMGLEEIPGVNLDDTLGFFLTLLVFGGALSATGIVLVIIAVVLDRKEKRI